MCVGRGLNKLVADWVGSRDFLPEKNLRNTHQTKENGFFIEETESTCQATVGKKMELFPGVILVILWLPVDCKLKAFW